MAKFGNGNRNIYRNYQVVDIDTGEILKKPDRKEWITVNNEIKSNTNEYIEKGYVKQRTIITTTRFVKHTGQTRIEIPET